ncbi:Uncharacterised protein [Raoultella ornithinolytica]|nr:Uncharacterised protein [Raoultella ornithinolytica]
MRDNTIPLTLISILADGEFIPESNLASVWE